MFTIDFQDYRQEFNKTRSNVASIIERHDLLDSVHKDISDYQRNMSGSQGNQWTNIATRCFTQIMLCKSTFSIFINVELLLFRWSK